MQAQVSIFDPQVRVPPAARPVDGIPAGLRQWYRDVFQSAHRAPPPSNFAGGPAAQTAPRLRVRQALNASVKQERLGHAGENVLAAFNGFALARSSSGLLVWDALRKAPLDWIDNPTCQAVLGRKAAILRLAQAEVLVRLEEGVGLQAQLRNEPAGPVLPTRAHGLWQSGNRLFALVEGVANGLVEVNVAMLGGRALVSVDKQWPVSTLATEFYRGCFVQDCLGAPFVGVLEGSGVVQAKAPALRGYRVIDALGLDSANVWVVAVRKADGQTCRLRFAYDAGAGFVLAEEEVVQDPDLDGAVLLTGVGVVRLGDNLRVSKGPHAKEIASVGLDAHARLFSLGAALGLVEDGEVSKLSLG